MTSLNLMKLRYSSKCITKSLTLSLPKLTKRFDRNSDILNAVESASDFLKDNFNYDDLKPLTELPVTLPTPEKFSVVKTYLINEKNKPDWQEKTILQSLAPVKSAFPNTYRLFEGIETFGATTSMNESSFSALSRIDTIRRSSMTNQRLRDLAFLGFEKKRLNSLNVDVILRKFSEKTEKSNFFDSVSIINIEFNFFNHIIHHTTFFIFQLEN